MKKVLFIFNNEILHEALASDLDTETIIKYKSALAASKGIDCDLIEVESSEGFESSDCFVRSDGSFMYHPKNKTYPVFVSLPVPAMDINHEGLFQEFLDLIVKGNVGDAIIFM
jgi:hypothetical protein